MKIYEIEKIIISTHSEGFNSFPYYINEKLGARKRSK